jgi:2-phosphosulfolactate phosphatase
MLRQPSSINSLALLLDFELFDYSVKLYTYHTPELTTTDELPECAIAIDVLRATSTIATALHAGAEGVQAFSDMKTLIEVSEKWEPSLRLRGGERGGSKVEGCDLGNSPLDCTPAVVEGKRLFVSTTNGTRTLERIRDAKIVLAAALINRQAIADYVLDRHPHTVWMVGSGWEGTYSLEDTVCAGAIISAIAAKLDLPLVDIAGNDETIAALSLYRQWEDSLLDLLSLASHGQRLLGLECHTDLQYCSELDTLDIVPIQSTPGVLTRLVG